MKTKNKNESEMENENENEKQNENKNSVAIDGQLSLDWPRSAIAFLLNQRGLEVA